MKIARRRLKIFRLRRAIFMLEFLYKKTCSSGSNPTNFPPAAGSFLTDIKHVQRANRFANSRSAFCSLHLAKKKILDPGSRILELENTSSKEN